MTDSVLVALIIFVLRIVNNAVSTIRVVYIARQQRLIAAVLGFVESAIFAITVASVVRDLTDPLVFVAYSGGYAVGSYLGMWMEERLVKAFMTVNVVLQNGGHELATTLRDQDFGVTETVGEGRAGKVTMLRTIVDRRDVRRVTDIIRQEQPEAFISMEETRAIRRGYFPVNGRRR